MKSLALHNLEKRKPPSDPVHATAWLLLRFNVVMTQVPVSSLLRTENSRREQNGHSQLTDMSHEAGDAAVVQLLLHKPQFRSGFYSSQGNLTVV